MKHAVPRSQHGLSALDRTSCSQPGHQRASSGSFIQLEDNSLLADLAATSATPVRNRSAQRSMTAAERRERASAAKLNGQHGSPSWSEDEEWLDRNQVGCQHPGQNDAPPVHMVSWLRRTSSAWIVCYVTETNKTKAVLFGMQNRIIWLVRIGSRT
jgi:hypothetical protein